MTKKSVLALLSALRFLLIIAASSQTRAPQILFGSATVGPSDIFAMDADGSNQRRLVTKALAPIWSRDGCRIVFRRGKQNAGEGSFEPAST